LAVTHDQGHRVTAPQRFAEEAAADHAASAVKYDLHGILSPDVTALKIGTRRGEIAAKAMRLWIPLPRPHGLGYCQESALPM
jgi:hypothetical protein